MYYNGERMLTEMFIEHLTLAKPISVTFTYLRTYNYVCILQASCKVLQDCVHIVKNTGMIIQPCN